MRPDDERYFGRIEDRLDEAIELAGEAKAQGKDPEPEIEIPVARDMADRVENILGIKGVAKRVRELEGEMSREEAALELVTDFVEGTVGDYDSREGKIEGAVRTAVALLTEGVVAAPIEGIDRVELVENSDGTEFVNVYYAGPIRSAGGTAQALSVLVADYARSLLGISEYDAREDEVERYVEEIGLYDKETGLQYSPKDKETRFIARNMPIMLDGEATGDEEVSGYRDLERVDTNSARGGMCLVAAEGIALKAPKIQRYTRQLEEVDWPWLQDLIDGTIGTDSADAADEAAHTDGETEDNESDETDDSASDGTAADASAESHGPVRAEPATKYLRDLIAGRPVFGHPSEAGGFRLRYGRARNHGFATAGVHPATMHLIDDFLATGTQIKTERPGKAAGVVPVDSIEGPTVRLANGDVRTIDDPAEALAVRNGVEEIIDVGEYLVNIGEFIENNHSLVPASYVYEWWIQDLEAAGADVQALSDDPRIDLHDPTPEEAIAWATDYDCPLHPAYTYLWHDISVEAALSLAEAIETGEIGDGVLAIERTETTQRALESLLCEHSATADALRIPEWRLLVRSLGISDGLRREWSRDDLSARALTWGDGENAIELVNEVASFEVRERAPTRIGNRMGRPEKSEKRDLSPAVHTLFPIRDFGGNQRNVAEAARQMDDRGRRGVFDVQIGTRECPGCGTHTYKSACPDCGAHTEPYYECENCGIECEPDESGRVVCPRCESEVSSAVWQEVDLREEYRTALSDLGEREASFDILKGVKGLTSEHKVPEPIAKGVLRAKHGVSTFKDGTVRYDMTDLPVTSVRPEELDVTADHFRELGYETDIDGDPLVHDDQLVELKVQDIVLSDGAAEHMMRTADFVDELLTDFYDLPAFYELNERDDLIGELVFGMAPHTSAAVVGRVVGFTTAAVGYAHPYFHAAKRRNCFHPETKLWYRDAAGAWHHDRIDTFVEDRLTDPAEDDFGTLVSELDGDVFVPSVTEDGEEVVQPVEAVSKHIAPDHMVRVETERGREITVTPDHEMHVFEDGAIRSRVASELTSDDHLITPAHLDVVEGEPAMTADLVAAFAEADADVGTKRVPQCVFNASDDIVAAYLRQFFDGAESTDRDGVVRSATIASRELKDDLLALLSRLGIDGRAEIVESATATRRYVLCVQSRDAIDFLEHTAATPATSDQRSRPEHAADGGSEDAIADSISAVTIVDSDIDHTYCLTVAETHSLVANDLSQKQCDGDEDCVMLLMDGLLNFSKSYLPDKRGGSVAEDSRLVAVGPDGSIHFTTFEAFWDELDSPIEYDGKFRKKTCVAEGWQTYAFDDTHEASLKPIEKAIRYEADENEQLLRIETQFGRSLDITDHHSLFRYDDGIEEVAGADLEAGDLIVAPRTLDVQIESTTIDVVDAVDDPYVFIDDAVQSYLTDVWAESERGSETRAAFDGGLSYRLSKNKTGFETLTDIASTAGVDPDRNATIGLQGSSTGIDRYVDVDESFAWLLGMFVAEGSLSGTRPTIHNADEALIDRVVAASEQSLGVEPTIRWSNRAYEVAFPTVFREVLYDLGFEDRDDYHSSEKVIPDCILRSRDEVALSFLRGFIAGDGSEQSNDNHSTIAFSTTSEDVKDGLVFLLHRFGLVANISKRERDARRQPSKRERDARRQPIYDVTVSGGAADNPLRRLLDGERPYQPKSLVVSIPEALMDVREMDIPAVKQIIPKYLKRRNNVSLEKLREMIDELDARDLPEAAERKLDEIRPLVDGDLSYLRVTNIERVAYDGFLYDLQVGGDPVFTANWLYAHNSMDAPLVMSSRIDPSEIDDEAHNMDIVREYPREFYEATLRMADPDEAEELVTIAEDILGTDEEYHGFDHTHDTTTIHMGPSLSAYKTLGSMMDKMDAQLELARKLRAVDETDVAERVIEYHFLPDLIGNLRAFSRQETRCLDCGEKYRRMPLTGDCRECGGRVNLTVHQGSVNKYMDTAIEVADRFDCREYTKQRLAILERSLESVFEDDTNKQSGIADFM